jgi:hypothetical protein
VLQLIREFRDIGSKEKDIQVNLKGFKEEYQMDHSIEHVTSN